MQIVQIVQIPQLSALASLLSRGIALRSRPVPPTAPQTSALSPEANPILTGLFFVVAGLYALALLVSLVRPKAGRWIVAGGAALHLVATVGRGLVIGFFPLTGKMESFSAFSLTMAIVAALAWRPVRLYAVSMLALVLAGIGTALSFPLAMRYPPALMWTIWYPLHVPLSFFAYALWGAAAAAAISWGRDRDPAWLPLIDRLALLGFGLWSLSMVCGGIWGVVAWGAYFLWDPKVIWSVLLWFHYAAFIHVKLAPTLRTRAWLRPALAVAGLLLVFVAYVGTSFFFGRSSHAF
jgi:hypothetical protein